MRRLFVAQQVFSDIVYWCGGIERTVLIIQLPNLTFERDWLRQPLNLTLGALVQRAVAKRFRAGLWQLERVSLCWFSVIRLHHASEGLYGAVFQQLHQNAQRDASR